MKILVSSHAFAPSVGGLETASLLLARAFRESGHEVCVVTQTPADIGDDDRTLGLAVLRRPKPMNLLRKVIWCDVYWQNNIGLRTAWPLLLVRRPWVVTTQTWLDHGNGRRANIKRSALRRAENIAISAAIADNLHLPAVAIGNPYDDTIFRRYDEVEQNGDLVFVGRLVSDKGVDVLIKALELLAHNGLFPRLTIIGSGPEQQSLELMVKAKGLQARVNFVGPMQGVTLARELNRHRILVVPSAWAEPFGIVALEGIACRCIVVGSEAGGLAEAIGPCGLTFPNGDGAALADRITQLLKDARKFGELSQHAEGHLARFKADSVADRYLQIFSRLTKC